MPGEAPDAERAPSAIVANKVAPRAQGQSDRATREDKPKRAEDFRIRASLPDKILPLKI